MKFHRLVAIVSLSVLTAGAVSISAREAEVSREGKWRIWYTSPDLRAELDYHWADGHLGDEWMILKLSIAGASGGVTTVARENVRLRGPDGATYDLPTQAEFRGVRGSMSMAFRQESAWGPPASRFAGSLRRAEEWFFSPPGQTFHRETVHPSSFQYCSGPLVFQVPGGVQAGGWTLIIDLEEMRAKIPFVLGENEK
jgi:hypothetical protein